MRILRLPEVKLKTALGRSSIYALISQGDFPKQIVIGGQRSVGWLEDSIEAWIQQRVERSSRRRRAMR